jgi:hypothetical protein
MKECKLLPAQIKKLTLPEVLTYLEESQPSPAGKAHTGDVHAYANWIRSLSPSELLRHATEGTL